MEWQPQDVSERTLQYSLRAIRLYQTLHVRKDGAGSILAKQYLRSASAIGANLEGAQAAESRVDFLHKHGIALKGGSRKRLLVETSGARG